jgi:hypothetical protein
MRTAQPGWRHGVFGRDGIAYSPSQIVFNFHLDIWTHFCYHLLEHQTEEKAMFNIEFYSTADGVSELWNLDDTYVLLHQFRKKTQKTPRREIDKAKAERDDWIARKG